MHEPRPVEQKRQKHHYIPEFYLKKWSGPDGRLCEYSRPFKGVVPKMKHPGATGYKRGLYSIPEAPANLRDVLENKFLSIADGLAAQSLRLMVEHEIVPYNQYKIAWTRFMMSLFYRTPEGVARSFEMIRKHYEEDNLDEHREEYAKARGPDDPEAFEEFLEKNSATIVRRTMVEHLISIIDSQRVGEKIVNMRWNLVRMNNLRHPLLTSDRPIIMTNGIAYDHSHIVMPISPQHIFVAANSDTEVEKLKQFAKGGVMAATLNDRVVRQARKFVYGANDRQLRFVENRLGEKAVCSPFE